VEWGFSEVGQEFIGNSSAAARLSPKRTAQRRLIYP
jgi:hypothetical protein